MVESINSEFVVDASFVLAYLFPDEEVQIADEFFNKYVKGEINCISTVLLPFEVLNSLKVGTIRKRISKTDALQLAERFFRLHINLKETAMLGTIELAIKENLTVYDASYVVLARNRHISLLTLDHRLKKLAK